jgi:hypothetical protein
MAASCFPLGLTLDLSTAPTMHRISYHITRLYFVAIFLRIASETIIFNRLHISRYHSLM